MSTASTESTHSTHSTQSVETKVMYVVRADPAGDPAAVHARLLAPALRERLVAAGATRVQVNLDDAAAADEIFAVLMGEDVESRHNFIQRNAKDVCFLDI